MGNPKLPFPTWWEELYKLLEFVKRWSEIPKRSTMMWLPCCVSLQIIPLCVFLQIVSAYVYQEMVLYVGVVALSCERGYAYSEAKSITELYALAYSSVASQVSSPGYICRIHHYVLAYGSTVWLPAHGVTEWFELLYQHSGSINFAAVLV